METERGARSDGKGRVMTREKKRNNMRAAEKERETKGEGDPRYGNLVANIARSWSSSSHAE